MRHEDSTGLWNSSEDCGPRLSQALHEYQSPSPNCRYGKTEFFEIVAGVLQGDTFASYLFIIVVDYCMRLVIEKHLDSGFTITPEKSRIFN